MRRIKRKGELLPDNVASVVIVVIGLGFLLSAVGMGIYNFFSNQEEQNAQKTLDSLMGKISALEDGESNEFLIQGVEGWYLLGYDLSDEQRPDKCFFNSCVCLCESYIGDSCQSNGFCREVSFDNVSVSSYYDESTSGLPAVPTIPESYDFMGNLNCIYLFKDKLYNLEINRKKESLEIFYSGDEELNKIGSAYLCIPR